MARKFELKKKGSEIYLKSKPLIGLTPSYYEHKGMDRSILGKSYTDRVQEAGGLPIIIPPITDSRNLTQLMERLDGIVLTGGDDLNPDYYGENPIPLTTNPLHERRGHHDRQVFDYLWSHQLPTLAICLGMQEINVFLGGSLYQDIPEQIKGPLIHKIGDWFEARHTVSLDQDSLLYKLTQSKTVETNSAHHQALRKIAHPLKEVGVSQDGIIEALEPKDPSMPLLAVQWHPESETNDLVGLGLFKWLISQA